MCTTLERRKGPNIITTIFIQSALMSPCEVCHSKWERLFINLKLLFHLLQMNFFARTFYLQPTSRLFYCYSETTTSLIYKKKLFRVFFPKLTGAPVVTEPNRLGLSDPSRTKGVSAMLKILFWAERVTWLRLTHMKPNSPTFLGRKTWSESIATALKIQQQQNILSKNCWGNREGKRAVR